MRGTLTIITGPMFAGKTTALLEELKRFPKEKIQVFKPTIDVRYKTHAIASHDGGTYPAILINRDDPHLLSKVGKDIQAVFIDELNFFQFGIVFPYIETMLSNGTHVFGSGLSYDFAKNPFGATLALSQRADTVRSLCAVCDGCGKDAIHSYRKKKIQKHLVVGGAELYGACCESCFPHLAQL